MSLTVEDIIRKYRSTDNEKALECSSYQTTPPLDSQARLNSHKSDVPLSEERRQQIEFCHLLWEGACEKVSQAKVLAGASKQTVSDDLMFLEEDIALRRKIFDQLQNPQVNFRNFALLVYHWRDMHLNKIMPKKQTLGIPSWQPPICGARGKDEEKNES
ncbi:MAG: hypothetical protein CVU54_14390 [Deltaproteobacteria bacterium HGW-Deltaproteobacteria-12]|jgi:hypothetical protein|nr:MAG: hypothetical protein CVU54_14390 [Deltaproteobacteria bacterium HGW-Deltaproteobacteria-12]